MAGKGALASYWNGSAWVDIVNAGTTNSAVINVAVSDIIHTPTAVTMKIHNESATPLANNSSAKGPWNGVFTDFMPIRIKDTESQSIYFYGFIYSTKESYDRTFGMVIDVSCKDFLQELKDNSTLSIPGFKINTSANVDTYVTNFAKSNIDSDTKLYNTVISSRSAIIKSLIGATSSNVTITGDVNRLVDSVEKLVTDDDYVLGNKNQASILQHIYNLSQRDPQTAYNDGTEEVLFGYDYYVDPNFTLTTASHKPTAFFNYFKKGTRPTTVAPLSTYGLQIHLPEKTFTETIRKYPMQEWEFERPKGEIYTDAAVKFKFSAENEDGSMGDEVEIDSVFEAVQVKAVANGSLTATASVPRWKSTPILSVYTGFNEDDGTYFPEWMQVRLDGSGEYVSSGGTLTTIARIQYINKVSSVSNSAPAYMLISDVDESIDASAFAENVLWYGKDNTTASIQIKSRPRTKYGVKRTMHVAIGESSTSNLIRQDIAAALLRKSNQVIFGEFKTLKRPEFAFDNSPSSVSGTTTQDITLASANPLSYGFRVGMSVCKLVNGAIPKSGLIYGYASAVTSTTITVTWNTGSGISASDTLRYFVPVRAGDMIHCKNTLAGIDGNFLVLKLGSTEQSGVSQTTYDVVGMEDNTEGGYNRKNFAVATAEAVSTNLNIAKGKPNSQGVGSAITTCVFTSTAADRVDWTDGVLTISSRSYSINAGTTASTMIASGDGNTGQSGTTLASGVDYYIYYPGDGTVLKTIRKANYYKVAPAAFDPIVVGWVRYNATGEADFGIFAQEFSIGSKSDADKRIGKYSLTSILARKGIQSWSTDIVFVGTSYNAIKWHQLGASDTTAGAVSFADNTTEAINVGTAGSISADATYIYKSVGSSASTSLTASTSFGDVFQDDRILLATVTAASDSGASSPNIQAFNGSQGTISAGVISTGAILAGNIKAGEITASFIGLGNVENLSASQIQAGTDAGDVGLGNVGDFNPAGQLQQSFASDTRMTEGLIAMRQLDSSSNPVDVIQISGDHGAIKIPGTIVKTGFGTAATFTTTSYTDGNSQTRGGGLYMDADGLYSVRNTGATGTRAPLLFAGGTTLIGSTSRNLSGYLMTSPSTTGYRVFFGGEGLYVGTKDDITSEGGTGAGNSGAIILAGNWQNTVTGLPTGPTSSIPRFTIKSYAITNSGQTSIIPSIRFNNDHTYGIHNYTATGADAFEGYFGPNIKWSTNYKVTAGASPTSGDQSIIDYPLAYLSLQMPEQISGGFLGGTAYTMPNVDASGDNIKAMISWYGFGSNTAGGGADFFFTGGSGTSVIIANEGGLWMTNNPIKNVDYIRFSGGDGWEDYRTGPAIKGSLIDTADYQIVLPPVAGTTTNNTLVVDSVSGTDLIMAWEGGSQSGTNHLFTTATSSGSVPTSSYGTFRYALDGGGGTADVLAFSSAQTNATPNLETAQSTFWSMLSESNGSTGSRLIFEPIVGYGVSDNSKNLAYIGWHNHLAGIFSYYINAGVGSEAFPSHTFFGDTDTGMYRHASNVLGWTTGGADRLFLTSYAFYPADDDALDLGTTSGGNYRWDNIYATNTTVSTSDRREKTNITPTLLGLDFINDLNPVSYKWKKKPERPTYYGLIAQEVIETLKEHGIESRDGFGGITGDEDSLYGARYEEFIPILMKAVQELSEKVKKLEEEK